MDEVDRKLWIREEEKVEIAMWGDMGGGGDEMLSYAPQDFTPVHPSFPFLHIFFSSKKKSF